MIFHEHVKYYISDLLLSFLGFEYTYEWENKNVHVDLFQHILDKHFYLKIFIRNRKIYLQKFKMF